MSAFVLTFTQNDLTLVEIYTVVLHFGLDTCQIKLGFVQVNTKYWKMLDTVVPAYDNITLHKGPL